MATALTFNAEEVEKNYPAFFKMFPFKADEVAIGSVFKKNFEEDKLKLRQSLPFGEDGRVDIAVYEDIEEAAKISLNRTMYVLSSLAISASMFNSRSACNTAILNNKMPDGSKFSKLFLKTCLASSMHERTTAYNTVHCYDLCLELPRLPLDKKYDLACIVQNFYSELAKLSGQKLRMHLSVNPYDIANASNDCNFSSCNKLGGEFQTAPICAAASENIAMLRLVNQDNVLQGRCYIAFSPDMRSYVVQPTYGFMKEEFVSDAKTWINLVINKKFPAKTDAESIWKQYFGPTNISPDVFSNDGTSTFYVDQSSSVMFRADYSALPAVRVGGCHCLKCGKPSKTLICRSCDKNLHRCTLCCHRYVEKHGDICTVCAEEYTACSMCKLLTYRDELHNGMCTSCRTVYATCPICASECRHSSDGRPSAVEIVTGAVYAHTACVDRIKRGTVQCTTCGTRGHYSMCDLCRLRESVHSNVLNTLDRFNSLRSRLRGIKNTFTSTKSVGSILYPDGYNIAQ